MATPKPREDKVVRKRPVSTTLKKKETSASKVVIVDKTTPKVHTPGVLPIASPKGRKPQGKKIAVQALKEDPRKIEIIHNLTKRKVKESVEKKKSIVLSNMSLALLSPFRFPVDQSLMFSNIARYAGTVFVVLGAFFTLYNMSAALTVVSDSALVAQTTTSTGGDNLCSSGWCTQPPADIRVESTNDFLTGTVPVVVTVERAYRVDLVAINKDKNTTSNIGTMFPGDTVWRAYWQTTQFDDGRYRIKAIIFNDYGSYAVEESVDYIIANHPIDTGTAPSSTDTEGTSAATTTDSSDYSTTMNTLSTETSLIASPATTTSSTTNSTLSSTTTEPLPSLTVKLSDDEPLHDSVEVRTYVTGASSVRLYVRKTGANTSTLLGNATLHSTGEWRFEWETRKQQDGEYDLRVQAIFPNERSNSKTISALTIENSEDADAATTTAPTANASSTTAEDATPLEPVITVALSKSNPLSNGVDVYITAKGVSFVELYARPDGSLVPKFLGLAERQSDTSWRYRFDTTALPNGYYALFADVRHSYGTSRSDTTKIRIENALVREATAEEDEYIETLENAGDEVDSIVMKVESQTVDTYSPYTEISAQFDDESQDAIAEVISDFRDDLDRIISEYSSALRANDMDKVRTLQNELEQIRKRVLSELPIGADQEVMLTRINEQLGTIIKDLRERIERSETLIKERVGDAITKDSDNDGISDYDEVNLYGTDPFSADTDKDGFIDGIEVLNGYDPLSSATEVNVQYESPREQGVVREDLLTVDQVTTVEIVDVEDVPKAHMAGRALPNSFVTLYIFSTPIVVTVKADSSGNWSYLFDKELEDGEHEVYIGITDNAGRIVAKSNPLAFVKTAQAFTPVDAEANAAVSISPEKPSLISQHALLVVGSLSIVSLGLVLILLGLHVRPKEPEVQFA